MLNRVSPSYFKYLLPFIGGVLYASGFPFWKDASFAGGPLVGLVLYFGSLTVLDTKKVTSEQHLYSKKEFAFDALKTFLFAAGFNLLGFYWIAHTLQEFGAIGPPVNIILGSLFTFILLPHLYLFIFILFLLLMFKPARKWFTEYDRFAFIDLALLLTILEEVTPELFPAHVGHSLMAYPQLLGLAPIGGASFYSFLTFWLAFELFSLIRSFRNQENRTLKTLTPIFIIITTMIISIGIYPLTTSSNKDGALNLRLVQPNIGNNMKINALGDMGDTRENLFSILSSQAKENLDHFIPDLLILPETVYPNGLLVEDLVAKGVGKVPRTIREMAQSTNSSVYLGAYRVNPKAPNLYFEGQYNSGVLFNKNGEYVDSYNKQVLLPFGETLPFGPLNKAIGEKIENISFFAKGDSFPLFKVKDYYFSSAICYEILFTRYIRDSINSVTAEKTPVQFIVNLTNDSWYGNTSEPYQHLFLSKWRAMEFGIPIVRSTNTGISTIIYPNGKEQARLNLNQRAVLDQRMLFSTKGSDTIYLKMGLLFTLFYSTTIGMILSFAFGSFKRPLDLT